MRNVDKVCVTVQDGLVAAAYMEEDSPDLETRSWGRESVLAYYTAFTDLMHLDDFGGDFSALQLSALSQPVVIHEEFMERLAIRARLVAEDAEE